MATDGDGRKEAAAVRTDEKARPSAGHFRQRTKVGRCPRFRSGLTIQAPVHYCTRSACFRISTARHGFGMNTVSEGSFGFALPDVTITERSG